MNLVICIIFDVLLGRDIVIDVLALRNHIHWQVLFLDGIVRLLHCQEQLVLLVVVELVVVLLDNVQDELVVPLLRMLRQRVDVVDGNSALELLFLDVVEVQIGYHNGTLLLHSKSISPKRSVSP